ncbi:hypothetical protein GGR52DRAFT_570681 [Hypoxylon sp. FL1284]|nr:hypothetical protein GGR52DRAFT_570681 [Hypoxylon sp. FL1284]
MAARHDLEQQIGSSAPDEMASKTARYQLYPPPQALPHYVNRALPPRPSANSSSSSVYDSSSPGAEGSPTKSVPRLPVTRTDAGDEHIGAGVLDDEPGSTAAAPPPSQEHEAEIAAPQTRYPSKQVLEAKNSIVVSPLSASLPGDVGDDTKNGIKQEQPYEDVSPVSPADSQHSLRSRTSDTSAPPPRDDPPPPSDPGLRASVSRRLGGGDVDTNSLRLRREQQEQVQEQRENQRRPGLSTNDQSAGPPAPAPVASADSSSIRAVAFAPPLQLQRSGSSGFAARAERADGGGAAAAA